MSTTTTEDVKIDTRTPAKDAEKKKRGPSDWVVFTGHDVEWRLAGIVRAASRKAAITSVITNEKADAAVGPEPRRSYVAVLASEWQPLNPKVEQPPPIITLEAAK